MADKSKAVLLKEHFTTHNQGRLSMLANPTQIEKNGELLFSDSLFTSVISHQPMTQRMMTLNEEFQTVARQSLFSEIPEEFHSGRVSEIFSKKATNEDYPLDMKSLMMHPNNNYRYTETSDAPYQFKNKLIAILATFTRYIGPYFKYSCVLKIQLTCREANKLAAKPLRKYVLRSGHLDQELRAKLWLNHIKVIEIKQTVVEIMSLPAKESQVYKSVVAHAAQRLDERTKQEIAVDLNRTRTSKRVQTSDGQAELERVLQAVAICLPEVSYCQGMNFIASVLIAEAGEENGFYVLMYLMMNQDIRTLFLPVSSIFWKILQGFPELHLKNFQMAQLIKFHMPKFFQHLRKIQMSADYFTSKWFMTIFSCFLPYELLPPIFDMFITEGWKSIFRIGVALLKQIEPQLLSKDMMETCEYFRLEVRHQKLFDSDALFECAQSVRVNNILIHNVELQKLREKFYIIQVQVKLTEPEQWQADQITLLEKATNELAKLDPHAREDVAKFQAKLSKLDKELDRHSKMLQIYNLDYYAAREEYIQVSDRAKALNQTYSCLDTQLRQKASNQKTNKKFNQTQYNSNENNQTNMYQLEDGMVSEEEQQRRLLLEDLIDIEKKKNEADKQLKSVQSEYVQKKKVYSEAHEKFEDLLQYKQKVKDQMLGLLQMYEVKKEATLLELSQKLQQSSNFKNQHIF